MLESARPGGNSFGTGLAAAHDRAGRLEQALAHYLEEIDRPGEGRLRFRSTSLGPALERIA